MVPKRPRSHHEIAVDAAVHELMPDARAMLMLSDVVGKLRSGYYDRAWVRTVMQYWAGYPGFDLQDAYCFAHIHAAAATGRILTAEIEVGQEPLPDKEVAGQNERLRSLPSPFDAVFREGTADEDGYLRWNRRIAVGQELDNGRYARKQLSPGRVPLEVGYTASSRTLVHLGMERGLARWPYESTKIHLLIVVDPTWFNDPNGL